MYYQNCTASLGSQTRAIRAQHILTLAAIPCRVVSTTALESKRGCSHGVEFPCSMLTEAKEILSKNKISVRGFYSGDSPI